MKLKQIRRPVSRLSPAPGAGWPQTKSAPGLEAFRSHLSRSEQVVFDRLLIVARGNLAAMDRRALRADPPREDQWSDRLALRALLDLQAQVDKNNRDIRRLEQLVHRLMEERGER